MQKFILNECFATVAGLAAYQPKQNDMQQQQFVNNTSLRKTECQRLFSHTKQFSSEKIIKLKLLVNKNFMCVCVCVCVCVCIYIYI